MLSAYLHRLVRLLAWVISPPAQGKSSMAPRVANQDGDANLLAHCNSRSRVIPLIHDQACAAWGLRLSQSSMYKDRSAVIPTED